MILTSFLSLGFSAGKTPKPSFWSGSCSGCLPSAAIVAAAGKSDCLEDETSPRLSLACIPPGASWLRPAPTVAPCGRLAPNMDDPDATLPPKTDAAVEDCCCPGVGLLGSPWRTPPNKWDDPAAGGKPCPEDALLMPPNTEEAPDTAPAAGKSVGLLSDDLGPVSDTSCFTAALPAPPNSTLPPAGCEGFTAPPKTLDEAVVALAPNTFD